MTTTPLLTPRRSLTRCAGLLLAGSLALTACAPEEDPAEFDDAEASSDQEQTSTTTSAETDEDNEDDALDGAEDADTDQENSEGEDDRDGAKDADEDTDSDSEESEESVGSANEVEIGEALQTMTVSMVDDQGEVTIGLHALIHEGEVMALTLSFTPDLDGADEISLREMFDLPNNQAYSLRPYLNDRENLKRYSVLGSGHVESGWQSGADQPIRDGETMYHWSYFAAPEDDIDTVNIAVLPHVPEFEDVEIETDGASSEEPDDSDDAEDGE